VKIQKIWDLTFNWLKWKPDGWNCEIVDKFLLFNSLCKGNSQAGRRLYPSAATVSAIFVGDPNLSKQAASSKIATYDATIITPITTYDENLGHDKGKISQPANSKNTSEACKKSEKFLSEFWADGLDSDHASDEETDMSAEQEQNLEREILRREVYSLLLCQEGRRRRIRRNMPIS
jgi:hypothetical protein